jgi:hypothetical protein
VGPGSPRIDSLQAEIAPLIAPAGPAGAASPQPLQADIGPHLGLGALFALMFGATGYLAQGARAVRSRRFCGAPARSQRLCSS